jgi:RND superfamily putative drug exporter
MMLLGERNWQIPGWLDRVLPHLNIEGSAARVGEVDAPAPARSVPEPVTP